MKIGIIGAGFTGLSSAYYLSKRNHDVTIFEKDNNPGGLAIGFKPACRRPGNNEWQWSLEKHYHHFFTNDKSALKLLKEIHHQVIIKRPKTSIYIKNNFYQLDSPIHLLKLNALTMIERLRMGFVLGILRYNPFWQQLEGINADSFLNKTMGKNAYEKIWKPQLYNKFGKYAKDISLAWFWARIKKRTPSLVYPIGGFSEFAQNITKKIEQKGGKFYYNASVEKIEHKEDKIYLSISGQATLNFDKVIVTLPSFLFTKITPQLPEEYIEKLNNLKGLGAINLVLRLKKQFLKDNTYWLSICDKNSPIMAVVEHTNFIDKKYYNNEHLVYLANYLPSDDPRMKMTAVKLLELYTPYLKKINPNFQPSSASWRINFQLFKTPFAQPIIPINYSKLMPSFETPLKNIYLANIQQVYPWDRGTNYAIELGEKIAKIIG